MWLSGPVAEFHNQTIWLSCLYLNCRKFRKKLGVIDLMFHCCSSTFKFQGLVGRDHQTMGMPEAPYRSRGRLLDSRSVEAPTSLPGLPTSPWKGRRLRSTLRAEGTPRLGSRPPLRGKRTSCWRRLPKATTGGLAATQNSGSRLSPRETGLEQPAGRSRTIIYLP